MIGKRALTDVAATLKKQKKNTRDEFEERAKAIIVEFAQQVRKLPFFTRDHITGDFFFFCLVFIIKPVL